MASQKERNAIREEVMESIADTVKFDGMEDSRSVVSFGRISEGLLFYEENTNTFLVVKVIAKKEGFDYDEAVTEFEDKQKAKEEREKEKAKKLAEKGE